MDVAEAAYRMLVALAEADGAITPAEQRLLERYRRALGVRRRRRFKRRRGLPEPEQVVACSPEQNEYVLKMMVRVAHADGRYAERERKRLEAVAAELGIGLVHYAAIFVAVEDELHQSHGHRRSLTKASRVLGAGLFVIVAGFLITRPWDRPSAAEVGLLHERLDELSDLNAAVDEEQVRRSLERRVQAEEELAQRLASLDPDATGAARDALDAELYREVAALRAELDELRSEGRAFKEVETEYHDSVLLIVVEYDLVLGRRRATGHGCGTGFYITADGLVATNKHVVHPWKFSPNAGRRMSEGWQLDGASVRIAAWETGDRFRTRRGELDYGTAFKTDDGSLELVDMPADRFETRSARLASGERWSGSLHVLDDSDLALLQARTPQPVKPFRLPETLPGIEKLDHVMVLGFPTGVDVLERSIAETSPSVGDVSKVENTILVTAPIVPGNSGGPVVNLHGRVVGVATRRHGEPTLAICICVRHLLALLPEARELVERAGQLQARGHADGAESLLDLANRRSPDPGTRERIRSMRAELRR